MDTLSRDLAVSLVTEAEAAAAENDVMCGCGTNCTVCTGTGTRGCEKIVGDEALDELLAAVAKG